MSDFGTAITNVVLQAVRPKNYQATLQACYKTTGFGTGSIYSKI
jgi:hypothetical protein